MVIMVVPSVDVMCAFRVCRYDSSMSSFVARMLSALIRTSPLFIIVIKYQCGTVCRHFSVVCSVVRTLRVYVCTSRLYRAVLESSHYDDNVFSSFVTVRVVFAAHRVESSGSDPCGFIFIARLTCCPRYWCFSSHRVKSYDSYFEFFSHTVHYPVLCRYVYASASLLSIIMSLEMQS